MRSGHCLLRPVLAATLAVICSGAAMSKAKPDDLSGFSVMLQLGDSSVPGAIEIAPDSRWFLTASASAIYLSDLKTGAVLRKLVAPGRIARVAISKDGSLVFARYALDDDSEKVSSWDAETGAPVAQAETTAPASDDPRWNWIVGKWPDGNVAPYDGNSPRKYLSDQKIDQLVDLDRVERVEPTNHQNIVQVTVRGEDHDPDEAFTAYRFYYIDVAQKGILVDVPGKTLNSFCGQPHGAFAFDGRNLIVAPTQLDGSDSFINSILIATKATPPVVKWSRPCQDFQVAGLSMAKGLIVVSPSPEKVTIRDPATARRLAALDDIHDSDVLAWSRDLTTFAVGFHEMLADNQGNKFGVSLLRSGKTLFIPTDHEVLEIRLDVTGTTVFARTQTGWAAWNTSSGTSLPSAGVPPPDADVAIWNARAVTSPDGKIRITDQRQLIDTETGRVLLARRNLHLSDGWKYVWAPLDLRSFAVWDAVSGAELWTATAGDTNSEDFLILKFPDGRVRLSEGAERLVKLVRGFQVRPFDDAARRAFLHP
jgi:hypothetical protein